MLIGVTGRVDRFGYVCVCALQTLKIKYSVFYVYLCARIILCYFTGIFYAVVRHFCSVIHRQ